MKSMATYLFLIALTFVRSFVQVPHSMFLSEINQVGGSGEKSPSKDVKIFFPNFQICHNQFFYLKTQTIGAWKLQCAQFLRNQF